MDPPRSTWAEPHGEPPEQAWQRYYKNSLSGMLGTLIYGTTTWHENEAEGKNSKSKCISG
jgi:hypothetical protein